MANKPKDHTKAIDTIKKTVGELRKNLNKVTKGHDKMAAEQEKVAAEKQQEPSSEDHKAALDHFASQYKMAMMNKEVDKAKGYAKSYHDYAAKLDKHYHSKLKESFDICPECMEEPCKCSGNHIDEEVELGDLAKQKTMKHRFLVTYSDPNHTSVNMRKEKQQKHIRIPASHNGTSVFKGDAEPLVKKHMRKQGYRVHEIEHVGYVNEEAMNPYEEQIDEGTSAAIRMQRALKKVQGARERQERLAAPYVKSVMGKKEEKKDVKEAAGTKPGWMLKQDPVLAKKIADAKKIAKARKASYGDPSKGVSLKDSVKEEVEHTDYLLEYPEDLQKMKKADSYKIGDKIYTRVGGKWHKGHVTTPLNKAGNYGVKFHHGGKTHSYVSSPDELRLHVEEVEQVDELTNKTLISYMSKVNDDVAKHKMDPSKRSA